MRTITPNKPIDVPTGATVSFIESYVPRVGAILEIGCGSGHVAAELSKRGYTVVGVDSDPKAVSQARHLGVNIVNGSWPEISVERVSTVLFSRSLHHISPLPEAVAKIRDVILSKGTVLVEDFAFDEASPAAINWFLTVVKSQKGQALISPDATSFVTTLYNADDSINAWHHEHDHELHTATEMTRVIGEIFAISDAERVPYLYRNLVPVLPETPEAAAFIEEVYDEEFRLGKAGTFSLIGRRIVAVAP